jgi:hypothetical protein
MDPADLVAFHLRVDKSINSIMKDGKLDKHDIPELVLLLSELTFSSASISSASTSSASTSSASKLTPELLVSKMNDMYDYVLIHYKLTPEDEAEKVAYKQMFSMAVKLLVYSPKFMPEAKSCLPCFF